MKINYVEHKNGTKLFSFYRHDYKKYGEGEDYIMIDGGFDYTKFSGKLKSDEIKKLIPFIREQFTWGKNYNKNNVKLKKTNYILLKDLTTSHIINILIYFTNLLKEGDKLDRSWLSIHEIFLQELNYRKL